MGLRVVRRTRRLWSDDEKRSICLQTTAPDVSVAQVARRYGLNANLIFKWVRDPRFAPGAGQSAAQAPCFLPVEIVRRRMIWNIRGDFGAEVIGSSGSGYAALR